MREPRWISGGKEKGGGMSSSWEVEAFFVQLLQREGIREREQKRGIMVASLPPPPKRRKGNMGNASFSNFPPNCGVGISHASSPEFLGRTKLLLVRNLVLPKPATNRLPQPRKNFCSLVCVSVCVSSPAPFRCVCVCASVLSSSRLAAVPWAPFPRRLLLLLRLLYLCKSVSKTG